MLDFFDVLDGGFSGFYDMFNEFDEFGKEVEEFFYDVDLFWSFCIDVIWYCL